MELTKALIKLWKSLKGPIDMLIFGASGHSKVIYDCLISQKKKLSGIFDDDLSKKYFFDNKVLGAYNPSFLPSEEIIIGIGDNKIRENISIMISHKFGNIVHKSALVSSFAKIMEGTVIFHGAIVQNSSKIGRHCIINTNASVDHDCSVGDFVHLAPNVTICGGVCIGSGTLVGAGSVIIQNLKIGRNVLIGAGSVVIKDIPDNTRVFGNPAKKYGK